MEPVTVTRSLKNFYEIEELQKNSFPENEQYPMEQILSLSEQEGIEYLAFYDDDRLCGLMFYSLQNNLIYLFYIAVNPMLRSHGYGSKMLKWLKEKYPSAVITLNIEPLDEKKAANYHQRVLRFQFYGRNGFVDTHYLLDDDSGRYSILATKKEIDVMEYLQAIIGLGFDGYHPKVYQV